MAQLIDHHATPRMRTRAREHGLGMEKLHDLYRVVSPLSWPPLLPPENIFMYAGLGDRMSTPGQAHRLWRHWGEPRIFWYEGGHLTFLWSGQVSRFLDEALSDSGFVPRRQRTA
jgi:hypothetical protein